MSLAVLVVIVVVGIVAVVVAVHMTGGTRDARLADEAAARRRFAEDFPNETPRGVALTASGTAAFLELDGPRTGIVQSFGDRFLTRIVTPADIARVEEDGLALTVEFRDFTWRRAVFDFPTLADSENIATRLSPANQNEKRRTA
jgi:hypothetical protein